MLAVSTLPKCRELIHACDVRVVLETQYSGDTVVLVFPDGTGPALLSTMIAGVPYNRAHELEYQPGEIRLNVTMDSTLAMLKSKNREEYNNAITTGRKELKRLQEMKPDEVISVKDQLLEKDRLEMEEYMRKKEEVRVAKETANRSARDARERQMKEARKRSDTLGGGDDSTRLNSPVVLGVVGASMVGATLTMVGSNNGEEGTSVSSNAVSTETNSTAREQERESSVLDATNEARSENNELATSINADQLPLSPRDPVKTADEAMQEYMDSDDGGNAWLEVMSDLMVEEDGDADDDDDTS